MLTFVNFINVNYLLNVITLQYYSWQATDTNSKQNTMINI